MDKKVPDTEQANVADRQEMFDSLIERLSDQDCHVRKSAVTALGETGDKNAVEPLISMLSRELERDAGSYPLIIETLEALSKIPDVRALDAFMKIEARMIDRDSPRYPAGNTGDAATFTETAGSPICRAVTRELHYKMLDAMKRTSQVLNERTEQIAARYDEYQQEVIQAEMDRIMPDMAELLQRSDHSISHPTGSGIRKDSGTDAPAPEEPLSDVMPEEMDFDTIRREVETEIADYFSHSEKMWDLVRQGQHIKAQIRHVNTEKASHVAEVMGIDRFRAPC